MTSTHGRSTPSGGKNVLPLRRPARTRTPWSSGRARRRAPARRARRARSGACAAEANDLAAPWIEGARTLVVVAPAGSSVCERSRASLAGRSWSSRLAGPRGLRLPTVSGRSWRSRRRWSTARAPSARSSRTTTRSPRRPRGSSPTWSHSRRRWSTGSPRRGAGGRAARRPASGGRGRAGRRHDPHPALRGAASPRGQGSERPWQLLHTDDLATAVRLVADAGLSGPFTVGALTDGEPDVVPLPSWPSSPGSRP
ncbi:hypothetical protein NKG05_03730 [Oerskovia sp. M15]